MGSARVLSGLLQAVTYVDVVLRAGAGAGFDLRFRDSADSLRNRAKTWKAFLEALEAGDDAVVGQLLEEESVLVRLRDKRSVTALMKASNISNASRSLQMAKLLLDAGAQATIGAIDSKSTTALMYAAGAGHLDTVRLLLDRPASAASASTVRDSSKEVDGLLDAIRTGRLGQEIKAHGSRSVQVRKLAPDDAVKGVDSGGRTALMKASAIPDSNKSHEATHLLLQVGAKAVINVLDYEGKSALAHAAESGNFETCQLLINHTGSLGPVVALLPPRDIFQVTELNMTDLGCPLPDVCKGGKFFCFERKQFDKRFGELDKGSGETKFRAFANGRSGWIRVFRRYNTRGEDCGCVSCGRWDNETLAADWNWTIGDVIMHQAANYWPMGSRVRIVKGSRYSYTHRNEGTCATLTFNHYEDAGYRNVQFEDGIKIPYEFKDLEPCSEVMPFDVDSGECKTDPDHCVMSPSFPENSSGLGGCSVRIRTPARLHPVAFRVGGADRLEWQQEPPWKPAATLVWESAYNLLGVEPSEQKHNVTSPKDFQPFQASAPIMPWLQWSPNYRGGGWQGWRICEALMDWRDANGETAVMKAIDTGSENGLAVLEHLLARNANVEGSNKTGQTALMKACDLPDGKGLAQKAVGLLLTSSHTHPTLHAVDNRGRTALMYAVMQCSVNVVKALLTHSGEALLPDSGEDAGKLMGCVDNDGKGALLHAVEHCKREMVELLGNQTAFGVGAKVRWCNGTQRAAAAPDVHRDTANKTTVMYAAQRATVDILKYLVKLYGGVKSEYVTTIDGKLYSGVKFEYSDFVNRRDNESRSALSYAAKHGHWENIQFLKDHGANMTELSASKKTVLQYAVESGNSETVEQLLNSSDNMDQLLERRDVDNKTALMYAAGFSDTTTEVLIGRRADIAARDSYRRSVLMYAAQGGHASVVKTILRSARAPSRGNRSAFRALLDAQGGTPVDMISWKDDAGATALMYASQVDPRDASREATEVLDLLLKARADVSLSDSCYFTPLMAAAQKGYLLTVRALLDECENDTAVMNARDGEFTLAHYRFRPLKTGCKSPGWGTPFVWGEFRTAAWLAAENGHVNVTKELIQRRADTLLRDRWRMLPIEAAQKHGHNEVVKMILYRGHSSIPEQVLRTVKFEHFRMCLELSTIFSVVFLFVFVSCQTCCRSSPGAAAEQSGENGEAGERRGDHGEAENQREENGEDDPLLVHRQHMVCTDRGAILLAARALRFGTKYSEMKRKASYALNVCANVLMPFGPLMYFTAPDIVVLWWLALYFVLPVACSMLKACWPAIDCSCWPGWRRCCSWSHCTSCCSSLRSLWRWIVEQVPVAVRGLTGALVQLLQFPSLAMTGKYLIFPWILRWLRPRLLIFLVIFTELLMRIRGRTVSRPSEVLVFNHNATVWKGTPVDGKLWPETVDMFGLYVGFLAAISAGAVLWRTDVLLLFADIFTVCWVTFGTVVFAHSELSGPVSVTMALLLPSFPLCFYMASFFFMGKKDGKVCRIWWTEEFDGHDKLEIIGLAREIEEYARWNHPGRAHEQLALDLTGRGVKFWHFRWCDPDRPFSVIERGLLGSLSMLLDLHTIFFLLLADRFFYAGVMLFVCMGSCLLYSFLFWGKYLHRRFGCRPRPRHEAELPGAPATRGEVENGQPPPPRDRQTAWWDRLFHRGVPTVTFFLLIDRAHGFQDFFSLCITLRSLPLIDRGPWVMVTQMISVVLSTWGLTTFLFEKIELEITNLYFDSGRFWLGLLRRH